MPAGVTFRKKSSLTIHLVEAICVKTVVNSKFAKQKTLFTAGETYIASISSRGNYIVDTDGGSEKSLPPDEFLRIFKLVG